MLSGCTRRMNAGLPAYEAAGAACEDGCPAVASSFPSESNGAKVLCIEAESAGEDSVAYTARHFVPKSEPPVLLHNVQVHGPQSPKMYPMGGLDEVIDKDLCELLMDEFAGDLANFRKTQKEFKVKLSLLVEHRPADEDRPCVLLGFLAFKKWGLPSPGVSVGAVGVSASQRGHGYGQQLMDVAQRQAILAAQASGSPVGEVRLRSLASAVGFYKRLGFEVIDEGLDSEVTARTPSCPDPEAVSGVGFEDEDAPCVPMVLRCFFSSPGPMLPLKSPAAEPWTPNRSRAFEDGPTWPPMMDFSLPDAETLTGYVEKHPEKSEKHPKFFGPRSDTMKFPEPGVIEGLKSRGRKILEMTNVSFTYPKNREPTVFDINLTASKLSRVSVVGPSGAGRNTAIKLLLGELQPSKGTICKASGIRIASVAQDGLHNLEKHMSKTPAQYIMWRFAGNIDAESLDFEKSEAADEEEKLRSLAWCIDPKTLELCKCEESRPDDKTKAVFPEAILNRRRNKAKQQEYETKWRDVSIDATSWVDRRTLIAMGYARLVQGEDAKQNATEGLMLKGLTPTAVEKYLADFAIAADAAMHTCISALSDGEKVKVVLAASMWQNPHILVLSDLVKYLDTISLGALIVAIKEFGGGVIVSSSSDEFADSVCTERWIMDRGCLSCEGGPVGKSDSDNSISENVGNKIQERGQAVRKAKLTQKERAKAKNQDEDKKARLQQKDSRKPRFQDKDQKNKIKEIEQKLKDLKTQSRPDGAELWSIMAELKKLHGELAPK